MAPNAAPTPTTIRFNMPTGWGMRTMEIRILILLVLMFPLAESSDAPTKRELEELTISPWEMQRRESSYRW